MICALVLNFYLFVDDKRHSSNKLKNKVYSLSAVQLKLFLLCPLLRHCFTSMHKKLIYKQFSLEM